MLVWILDQNNGKNGSERAECLRNGVVQKLAPVATG